jgi:hypothetical protein
MIGSPGTEHPVKGVVTTTVKPPPGFEFRPGAAQLLIRVSDHTREVREREGFKYIVIAEQLQSKKPLKGIDCGPVITDERSLLAKLADVKPGERLPTVSKLCTASGHRGVREWAQVVQVYEPGKGQWVRPCNLLPAKELIQRWTKGGAGTCPGFAPALLHSQSSFHQQLILSPPYLQLAAPAPPLYNAASRCRLAVCPLLSWMARVWIASWGIAQTRPSSR